MSNRVVIALCYRSVKDIVIVPSCPFCFCTHIHHVPRDILTKFTTKHKNGEVVDYDEYMIGKISDCMFHAKTYVLELRDYTELEISESKLCIGKTRKGTPCKTKVKSNNCLCKRHSGQMENLIQSQIDKIFAI